MGPRLDQLLQLRIFGEAPEDEMKIRISIHRRNEARLEAKYDLSLHLIWVHLFLLLVATLVSGDSLLLRLHTMTDQYSR